MKLKFHGLAKTVFILALPCFWLSSALAQENHADDRNPLFISPASYDFSQNPDLLERIVASPHGYFRFINIPFSQEVCRRLQDALFVAPAMNLHGDAHIEQYAITDIGRGLTDFDDSSTGPAFIDLLRFGVSVHLACIANGWQDQAEKVYMQFLSGYRTALRDPEVESIEPALVKKIRAGFTIDREKYFQWVKSIMQPISPGERDSLLSALEPYFENMLQENPKLTPEFFQLVAVGKLQMGIGSALDLKYLLRVRGKTDDPLDDVALEAKQVRDLSGIDCIKTGQSQDPFRILLGNARIAYQPYLYLGYFRFRGLNFWVHSWVDNYKELTIDKSYRSIQDLAEVAYDVGIQLGKGHAKSIAAPLDLQLRREQLRLLGQYQANITRACYDLAGQTIAAWRQFRAEVQKTH